MSGASDRFYPPRSRDRSRLERVAATVGPPLLVPWVWTWALLERARARARRREVPSVPAPATVAADPYIALLLSVVPGAGHLFGAGSRRKGWGILGASIPTFVWVLLFPPGYGARLLFMALFGFHQWVMADAYLVMLDTLELPRPAGQGRARLSLMAVSLLSAVYAAGGGIIGSFGTVVRVSGAELSPLLAPGDRLWIAASRRYAPGDLVYSRAHGGIERVLAGPGDVIEIDEGRIRVNGARAAFSPVSASISGNGRMSGARLRVPDDGYCVLFPARHGWLFKNDLLARFMTPKSLLTGRVRFRYWPSPEAF